MFINVKYQGEIMNKIDLLIFSNVLFWMPLLNSISNNHPRNCIFVHVLFYFWIDAMDLILQVILVSFYGGYDITVRCRLRAISSVTVNNGILLYHTAYLKGALTAVVDEHRGWPCWPSDVHRHLWYISLSSVCATAHAKPSIITVACSPKQSLALWVDYNTQHCGHREETDQGVYIIRPCIHTEHNVSGGKNDTIAKSFKTGFSDYKIAQNCPTLGVSLANTVILGKFTMLPWYSNSSVSYNKYGRHTVCQRVVWERPKIKYEN